MALFGHDAMSNLSPLCAQKRTSVAASPPRCVDAVRAAECHLSPRSGVYSSPHPAHTSTNVDAHALARRKRPRADRDRWPTHPFEQSDQALGNESGSGGINVPVALGALAMRKEPLRHN